MSEQEREWLAEEARARWGDEWTIETALWADGTRQHRAFYTEQVVTDGVVIREYMTLDADEEHMPVTSRRLVKTEEFVASVDNGDPEIRGGGDGVGHTGGDS